MRAPGRAGRGWTGDGDVRWARATAIGLLVAVAVLLIEQQAGDLGPDEVVAAGILGGLAAGICVRGPGGT